MLYTCAYAHASAVCGKLSYGINGLVEQLPHERMLELREHGAQVFPKILGFGFKLKDIHTHRRRKVCHQCAARR